MTRWKDTTSYTRGDTERTPRVWTLDLGILMITVHRLHGCTGWFLTCCPLGVEHIKLDEEGADAAKNEGLEYVRATVNKMAQVLKKEKTQ